LILNLGYWIQTPEIPWREEMADLKHLKNGEGTLRKPVFGVMRWDNYVMLWPPIRRAMETTISAVKKAGYEGK
jgi:hypothetical protein